MYYNKDIFVNSQYVSNNGLFLPSYITIDNNTIKHICKLNYFIIIETYVFDKLQNHFFHKNELIFHYMLM